MFKKLRLSSEREDLLRRNRDRIAAYHVYKNPETSYNGCEYEFSDGKICAASACLKDYEREKLVEHYNIIPLPTILSDNPELLDLSDSDAETLRELQFWHDDYVNGRKDNTFVIFDTLVKELLGEV